MTYIRESILAADKQDRRGLRAGHAVIFTGRLTKQICCDLIAYIKSLATPDQQSMNVSP